jgi:hypothetical protein
MYIRELAKKLAVSEMWLKKIKYFKTNVVNHQDLEDLREIFLNKETNCSLIKAKKIEKIIKKIAQCQ